MSSSALKELAEKVHHDLATNEEIAEFIRLVGGEHSLETLKNLLPVNYDYTGVVLERIINLLPNDPKAYLSLALWKYNNGLDNEALQLLEKAREIAPTDQDVLRADVWFSFTQPPDAIRQKCRTLLKAFPNDGWAKGVYNRLIHVDKLDSLESPDWNNRWNDLVNQRWSAKI